MTVELGRCARRGAVGASDAKLKTLYALSEQGPFGSWTTLERSGQDRVRDWREKTNRYGMRSVGRVAAVLNHLGEFGPSSISHIAKAANLPRPTVLRLAEALSTHGLVARLGQGRYRLGPRLLFLALSDSVVFNLRWAALSVMQRLAEEIGETVVLSVLAGSTRMYIEQVESRQPVRRVIELNKPLPLHAGASGKSLLAWLPETQVLELVGTGPLRRFTERTITDVRVLLKELASIRRTGYAVSLGEHVAEGVSLSAPILGVRDSVLGSVTILAPSHRTPKRKLLPWAQLIKPAAREIAVAYGAVPPHGIGADPSS